MIPFNNRFHGHSSLNYVYRNGKTLHSRFFVVKITPNKYRKNTRIAVVVSKKIFKSAVRRNRVRRRVYEYLRLQLDKFNNVYDVVVIVTSGEVLNLPYDDISNQLAQLFDQARLLK